MELLLRTLLYLHIAAGLLSLVVAPVAMVVPKGGRQHRIWGKIYFGGMTAVITTAVIISIYKFIPFLLMIAVFSYYSIVTGYRAIYLKGLSSGQKPGILDWWAAGVTGTFNFGFAIWGVYHVSVGSYGFLAYLAIAFGLLGFAGVAQNVRMFINRPSDRFYWLYEHISGMLGGYIATLTAFSVTTFQFLPGVLRWTWPLIVGLPLINFWIRRYRHRLNKGQSLQELNLQINES